MADTVQIVVEASGLVRKFGDQTAVAGLDLRVGRGEMFGLVGPDGAGKSTAMRMLCGVLRPTGGTARIFGLDLLSQTEQIKARIGYLSQAFTLYGDLTIDENMEFFAHLHGTPGFRKRRDELLEFTRLTPFRKRLAQALSGGMKKKLALACSLIHTPDLILLDEPSTGVDPVSRGEFWTILSGILAQGTTILMTTPYLDEAERCHRIVLMRDGRVLKGGTPAEVRAAAPGQIWRIQCRNATDGYRRLRERWPATSLVVQGGEIRFWAAQGGESGKVCGQMLESCGLGPVHLETAEPTLEDAFVGLVSDVNGKGASDENR